MRVQWQLTSGLLILVTTISAAHAGDLSWDFTDGNIPAKWITPPLTGEPVPVVGWQVAAGNLRPNALKDVKAVIQTPAFRFTPSATTAFEGGLGSSVDLSDIGSGGLYFRRSSGEEVLLVQLIRLDQGSQPIYDLFNSGGVDSFGYQPWEAPDDFNSHVEPDGEYSIRFTAYDFDTVLTVVVYLSDLTITNAKLVGDYNWDGSVDAADYTVWQDTIGQSTTAGEWADGNGDTMTDDDDYEAWKNNFGAASAESLFASSSVGASVPEPHGRQFVTTAVAIVVLFRFASRGFPQLTTLQGARR